MIYDFLPTDLTASLPAMQTHEHKSTMFQTYRENVVTPSGLKKLGEYRFRVLLQLDGLRVWVGHWQTARYKTRRAAKAEAVRVVEVLLGGIRDGVISAACVRNDVFEPMLRTAVELSRYKSWAHANNALDGMMQFANDIASD